MKKVLLLTSVEVPFRGNLIEGQFLAPILGAGGNDPELKFRYLSLAPVLFFAGRRRPIKTYLAGRAKRAAIKSFTSGLGCRTDIWPILFPFFPRDFNLTRLKYFLYLASALAPFFAYLLLYRPALVIARSYPAASLARLAKKHFGIPYVFDLRGMYPEEAVNAGVFPADSPDYRFWKKQEKALASQASLNIVVSEPFAEHLKSIDPKTRSSVIPCCVNLQKIKFEPARRETLKNKYGLKDRFVLLHLGSFGTPEDRGLVAAYLQRFKKARQGAFLVVASGTPAFSPSIHQALRTAGLKEGDYLLVNPSSPEQLSEMLALGDAGLILERRKSNTKVCLSVKLGEYLAAGLPVICTPFVEGAARLVRQYDCGLLVDPEGDEPLDKEKRFLKDYQMLRDHGFKLAGEALSLEHCRRLWWQSLSGVIRT
ncbi:glycosyltransferase [candidate division TA06 bacterium]|uniref:Glycosyltransferase n=1 Tax=candidate division TA06 bacterium TaxID=2250710 RepID=A0A933IA81_UNCT6|nr:glycosyltransferase [candidate division TA06 bacterium]